MRTVLLFAHECAPFNRPESTVGAQRPAQFARWLPEFGWRAIVLCRDHAGGRPLTPRELERLVEERISDASPDTSPIISFPAPPEGDWFDRAWDLAARVGEGSRARAVPRRALTLARFFLGDYSRSWRPVAKAAARHVRRTTVVDLCLGEHTPDAGLFLARWYAREAGVPWVMDFRDPILFGYPPRVRPLLRPFARRALSGVSRIVTVTPECQRIDREMFDAPVELVTNGFDPEEFEAVEPHRDNAALTIVYTGGIWVQNALQTFLEGFARAAAQVEPGTLLFRYRGSSSELVHRSAAAAEVAHLCDIGAHIAREKALAMSATADLLLLFAPGDHPDPYWKRGVYPGKTFEYFGARRPILCVPGDRGILDDLLARTQTGVVARNPGEVEARVLEAWRIWSATGILPSTPNDDELRRYTRRATVERLARVLDDSLGTRAAAGIRASVEPARPVLGGVTR